ncbi:MAG: histidine kinase [Lachnospiraceae bacterium]|nr:histidine kinase [Lachnospiraceae bacterium]
MITLLRAFCASSCILTAIYYIILFRYYKGATRTFWFPILCLVFAINLALAPAVYPYSLFNLEGPVSLSISLYLATINLSSLVMNIYNYKIDLVENNSFINISNYIIAGIAFLCFAVTDFLAGYVLLLSVLIALFSYSYGLYNSIKKIRSGDKSYFYSFASYAVLLYSVVPPVSYLISRRNSINPGLVLIPLYVFLHVIMLTTQYRSSINRTKKIANTLFETIENITNSDNALQCTQLKSDFLYATLDMISEKCETDSFTAEDLTISLSKFLRHTLNFQQLKGVVPLSNELELSKAYTAIEKERFPEIDFVYKLPIELPTVYVPPLSIQPLIENAIEHGFDTENPSGKIVIKVSPYKDYCQIDVSDNGSGMPEEELERLPNSFIQTARIGLYSINKRLTERFGTGLVIQSAPSIGTSISFVVPPEGRYDEEVNINA